MDYLGRPLTLERIKQAYAATELRPIAGTYLGSRAGELCACALAAVALAEDACSPGEVEEFVSDNAIEGFMCGFDGIDRDPFDYEAEGWSLGAEARVALGLAGGEA